MPYARSHTHPALATDLVALFMHQLTACRLKPTETCVAITDTAWNPALPAACQAAAQALGAEAWQALFSSGRPVPEKALRAACCEADLIVYMTSATLHYRQEIREALDRGARVLCAMQPIHVLDRLRADPAVRERTRAGAALLQSARQVRITSDAGTDLSMDTTGRAALPHYGAADEPCHLDFWGTGMVETAQIEGTTEGKLVLDIGDCCFHLGRFIESRVTIIFEKGRAVAIEGGLDAFLIRSELEAAGDSGAFNAGHINWGTDHRAKWLQMVTQTPDAGGGGADNESFYGSIEVEIGSNNDVCFGGSNVSRAHLGLCLRNASLWLDGSPIVSRGSFVPEALR